MSWPFMALAELVDARDGRAEVGKFQLRRPRRDFVWEVGSRSRAFRRASRSQVRAELRALCSLRAA